MSTPDGWYRPDDLPVPSDTGSASDGRDAGGQDGQPGQPAPAEVGAFRQGSPVSRWALARYLVTQAVGERLSWALLLVAAVIVAVAFLISLVLPTWLAVVVGLLALAPLIARWLLIKVLQGFSGPGLAGADTDAAARIRALVRATRGDVGRELRRIGLPSRTWTMPVLAWRLAGARRAETAGKLRAFDVDQVVPAARVDDLHLLLVALDRGRVE